MRRDGHFTLVNSPKLQRLWCTESTLDLLFQKVYNNSNAKKEEKTSNKKDLEMQQEEEFDVFYFKI